MVKHLNNDEKIAAYKKMMRIQQIYLFSWLLLPLIVFILLFVAPFIAPSFDETSIIGTAFLIIVPIIFFNGFRLMAYDYCPWCRSSFFASNYGTRNMSGNSLLFRKKCGSCGEPKQQNVELA